MGLIVVAVLAAQVGAAWALARWLAAPRSRAHLALVCAGTVPFAGAGLAAAAILVDGRGSPRLADQGGARRRPGRRALGATSAPLLDRLTGGPTERRAALTLLASTGDADAVATLRWLIARGSPEAVVEAALAIDELGQRREQRVAELRAIAARDPSPDHLVAAADAITDLVLTGLADPTVVPRLASEARDLYRNADAQVPRRTAALVERWARLELAAARPQEALVLLSLEREPADTETAARLLSLRRDAVFAARERAVVT
jgi:hypothetical protein